MNLTLSNLGANLSSTPFLDLNSTSPSLDDPNPRGNDEESRTSLEGELKARGSGEATTRATEEAAMKKAAKTSTFVISEQSPLSIDDDEAIARPHSLDGLVDSTYMFNVEGLIPKLCQLAQEVGEDDRGLHVRSAALQALASMVLFMGEYSHISMNFDDIVLVILDNYEVHQMSSGNSKQDFQCTQDQNHLEEVGRVKDHVSSFQDSWKKVLSVPRITTIEVDATVDLSRSPTYWSKVCLQNMAKLAKEATTAKFQASLSILTSISDLIRHLRKCLQYSIESSNMGDDDGEKWNSVLHFALEECLIQLANKVGDTGPIIDIMAVLLENIPTTATIARAIISSVYRTAQLVASIPNLSYQKKAFPEALFHQLLLAMTHPDHETRVGSHRVFSAILVPTSVCPWSIPFIPPAFNGYDPEGTLLAALSGFASSGAIMEKLTCENSFENISLANTKEIDDAMGNSMDERWQKFSGNLKQYLVHPSPNGKNLYSVTNGKFVSRSGEENSSHVALVRCFQLAFSLRSVALKHETKASDLPEIISSVKFMDGMVDPHLHFSEVSTLHATYKGSCSYLYGSKEDDIAAMEFLEKVERDDKRQLKESVISHLMKKYEKLPEEKLISVREQLLHEFSPDDALPLGPPSFMETPYLCLPLALKGCQPCDEVMTPTFLEDGEAFTEAFRSHSDRKMSESVNNFDVLSVNQLIESVIETAQQVASLPTSTIPVPYDQMKSQCEALVIGKQQKMSVLQSLKHQQEDQRVMPEENIVDLVDMKKARLPKYAFISVPHYPEEGLESVEKEHIQRSNSVSSESEQSFRLPSSSPFDKFLKAAGC
ncbi:hypothetical protein MUK42_17745 [Musa troglodytarum]|uniref:ARM repeat superfamily protein n=1 Tax=Musa troglodytarum TaxID=320322 RepID=A0A9E7KPF0_9LILI|nr:hypothetical protein MUK42_17745 [Musa troglodytarum]